MLMSSVRSGQYEAMATLFERHHKRLFHFFLGLTGQRGFSEDLVQEVFLRILKYRSSFKPGSPFTPWMFRIARRLHLDQAYRHAAETPLGPMEEAVPDHREGIHERLERDSDRWLLARALEQLDPDKRELLLLSRDPGLTCKDLAAIFECTEGTVKVKVHRALQELRTAFQKIPGGALVMR